MELIVIIAVAALLIVVASAFVLLRDRRDELLVDDEPAVEERATSGAGTAVLEPDVLEPEVVEPEVVEPEPPVKPSFRERLSTARSSLAGYLGSVFSRGIDATTWEELEEALIRADVGVRTTTEITEAVRTRATEEGLEEAEELVGLVKSELVARLTGFDRTLSIDTSAADDTGDDGAGDDGPAVWLFVGVNGVGKTTTIGKLAARQVAEGRSAVLAAGDTFRAAAAEQLTMWADRAEVEVVRGAEGADPSSVVFDAVEAAAARDADVVLADTAGRLHTKTNLMEELRKVRRVAEKGAGTVTETLLVIDATTGQNGLAQAQQFTEAVDVTGVVLTKLDGSAKGGIVVAIHSELGVPVKLVGLGEGIADLVDFEPAEFVDALFE